MKYTREQMINFGILIVSKELKTINEITLLVDSLTKEPEPKKRDDSNDCERCKHYECLMTNYPCRVCDDSNNLFERAGIDITGGR